MKILYVATISNTVNTFLIPHIKMLVDQGYQVDVAFNIEQEVDYRISEMGCKVHVIPFQRNPFALDNMKSYQLIKKIIQEEQYDLVHTHTPIASAITRLACRNTEAEIYYTAHGFHFYKGAPLLNWLMFYPIERYLSRHTDTIITINEEDYQSANKFNRNNVEELSGVGLDTKKIQQVAVNPMQKRQQFNIPEGSFLMVSVGQLNGNKNHEAVIRALAQVNNGNIHYAICGIGNLEEELKELSTDLGVRKQVHFLGFRKDVLEILLMGDLFVFPSYREGLSVAVMEAMASGLPIVASDIRGNSDLIQEEGGYLILPTDISGFSKAIHEMYQKPLHLKKRMGIFNQKQVEKYDVNNVIKEMEEIYSARGTGIMEQKIL